ncbi:MAG: hypothetical protein HQL50_01125 [Magnetococcales bacterium]|nr:hypothetical protein [Magnetococcales bacterium]
MQEFELRDIIYLVFTHLRGMWRHRWHMVFMAWFICITGWTAVAFMEDQYVSRGRVLIEDPQRQISPFLKGIMSETDVTMEARKILDHLLSRPNLIKVIQETSLAHRIEKEHQLDEIINMLRAQLSVSPSRGNVYIISHRSNERTITTEVVKVLLNILMQDSIDVMTASQARQAQKFLENQIGEYEAKVAVQEQELREFKSKNRFNLSGGREGYFKELKKMSAQLEEANLKLRTTEKRREELSRQLMRMEEQSSPVLEIEQRIQELEARLDELLGKFYMKGGRKMPLYNESHPDVISLRRQIAAIEQQKIDKLNWLEEVRDNPAQWEMDVDPIYRKIKIDISDLDVELISLRERVQQLENRLSELRQLEKQIPAVEVELIRMEQHFSMTKERLLALLNKQSAARFSGDVAEGLSKEVRFRIIEQPSVPTRPVGPNRPLFLTVVLIGAVLGGVALALFLSVIRPVFDSPAALKKELGLPVLGMVSMVDEGPGMAFFSSKPLFVIIVIMLMGSYAGIMMFSHLM